MKKPSIDRKNNKEGYIYFNCRFIEHSENSRLGNIGKKVTEKQREASRKNLRKYRKENPEPWNKKKF